MNLRSIYDRRLRRRVESGKELLLSEDGSPTLVAKGGRLLGVRATDGSVIPIPEPPVARWLESDWGDTEWVLTAGGRWVKRWRR